MVNLCKVFNVCWLWCWFCVVFSISLGRIIGIICVKSFFSLIFIIDLENFWIMLRWVISLFIKYLKSFLCMVFIIVC